MPQVKDYAELNTLLWQRCQQAAHNQKGHDDKAVWDRWQEEKLQLRALPSQAFECCQNRRVIINSYSLVEFETNQYSVPVHYGSKEALVKAYVHRIEIYSSNTQQLLAVHSRSYGRGQEILVLDHYLELLAKKPGGLVNAKVVRHMPPLWKELLTQMKQKLHRGDKEFIRTLLLLRSYSEEVKEQTVLQALKRGLFVAEEIHDWARKAENKARGLVEVGKLPANACNTSVLAPDMTVYDRLISGVIHRAG